MSLLSTINSNHVTKPMGCRMVIAGNEKIGKTTFACSAPRPLLIPLEHGYSGINVNATSMIKEFSQVCQLLQEIIASCQAGQFPFQTLIFDSGTALEITIHDAVVKSDPKYKPSMTMESAHGGYGRAYPIAMDNFEYFLTLCDTLAQNFGINIIMTCHVFANKVIDPTSGEFDTWDLLLHSPKNLKTYGKRERLTQWADIVGFLHEPIVVSETESGMFQGISLNQGRQLGVERTPTYVAGNRYGLKGTISIPETNGWNAMASAILETRKIDYMNKDV